MRALLALGLALVLSLPALAQMRGHGGPVRAIAISPDGKTAVTGSFDTTLIVWNLETETAKTVLRVHEAPVNFVRVLAGGHVLSAGDDGRVVMWPADGSQPVMLSGTGPAITALATHPANAQNRSIIIGRADGNADILPKAANQFRLNDRAVAIATLPDGEAVFAMANNALRWSKSPFNSTSRVLSLPTVLNILLPSGDGLIGGGADGKVYFISADGSSIRSIEVQEMPVTSLATSPDGTKFAVAGLRGAVAIYDRQSEKELVKLVGPGLPVWSLAFHTDGKTLLTGGADRMVRKWDITTGQPFAPANAPRPDFPPAVMSEKGAQVFRACEACHTVTPDGGNRAGPTLHGVFGRKIGSLASYTYSDGFTRHNITWTAETISRLFREGPSVVTPGTKMPEQKVTDPEDLKALVDWLEKVTR
jgi:cytochrome c